MLANLLGCALLAGAPAAPAAAAEPYAVLAAFQGTWTWTAKMVWNGKESEFGSGLDVMRLVAGGKVLELDSHGTEGGQKTEAICLLGWHGGESRFYWFMASSTHLGPIQQGADLRDGQIVMDELKTGGDEPMVIQTRMELPKDDAFVVHLRFAKPDGTELGTVDYHYRRQEQPAR